jgi:hypothetical protein
MSPDARLAAAPLRVYPDAFQQFFARQMFHNVVNLPASHRFDHLRLESKNIHHAHAHAARTAFHRQAGENRLLKKVAADVSRL